MNKQKYYGSIGFCIVLSLLLFIGSKTGILNSTTGIIATVLSPAQQKLYESKQHVLVLSSNNQITGLKADNLKLQTELAKMQQIKNDNLALRDQFKITSPASQNLLPATIIGAPNFVVGQTSIDSLIINKGKSDGVAIGQSIVYQNNFVGTVTELTTHTSYVIVATNSKTSFPATTSNTNALGVAKGEGNNQIILDNVVLSDTLKKGDLVVSKGSVTLDSQGIPPGLVVGKIVAVSKYASNVFQSADVTSLLDFSKLSDVFVIVK